MITAIKRMIVGQQFLFRI